MAREKGFSLIELLIVVAIILVIAAIAIPSLMRSKIAANEASAVAAVRTITTAETAYAQTYPNKGYTCTLASLGPPPSGQAMYDGGAGIIDSVVASGIKTGYTITLSNCTGDPVTGYQSAAVPVVVGKTGQRAFCSDTSGIIWFSTDGVEASCRSGGNVLQ